jgi:hypothetical protein
MKVVKTSLLAAPYTMYFAEHLQIYMTSRLSSCGDLPPKTSTVVARAEERRVHSALVYVPFPEA